MLISKEEISSLFAFVVDKLQKEKFAALNAENKVESLEIKKQIDDVAKCLEATPGTYLSIDGIYAPKNIRRHWAIFDKNFDGNINDGYKTSYDKLLDEFASLLEQVRTSVSLPSQQQEPPTKIMDIKELDEKINSLQKSRERLKRDIERRSPSPQNDDEYVKMLRTQLEKIDAEYLDIIEIKKKMASDNVAEQNISDRVSKAFDGLQQYTKVIEEERKRLKMEYYIALWCIPILILFFVK